MGDESKVGSVGGAFPKASLWRKSGAEMVDRVNTEGAQGGGVFFPGCRQRAADKRRCAYLFVVLLARTAAVNLMKQSIAEGITQGAESSAVGPHGLPSPRSQAGMREGRWGLDGQRDLEQGGSLQVGASPPFLVRELSCCLLSHRRKM